MSAPLRPAGMLLADGLEHAFLGVMLRFGQSEPIACYDLEQIIVGYMRDGMTYEEAHEFFDFNVIGAWAGDGTPCFLERMPIEDAIALANEATDSVSDSAPEDASP